MIDRVIGFFQRQFLLTENTARNQKDIEKLREDFQRLQLTVERLTAEMSFIKATEKLERENLTMQINSILKQFEHSLKLRDKP